MGYGVSVKRSIVLFPLLGAIALGSSACDASPGTQPSQDTAVRTSPQNQIPDAAGPVDSSPTRLSGSLAQIDPCNLITQEDGAQFGVTGAQPNSGFGARSCQYPTSKNGRTGNIEIDIREKQGLDQFDTSQGAAKDITVGGRTAKEQQSIGGCVIAIEITAHSRVDVQYTPQSANSAEACQVDEQVARLVSGKVTGN